MKHSAKSSIGEQGLDRSQLVVFSLKGMPAATWWGEERGAANGFPLAVKRLRLTVPIAAVSHLHGDTPTISILQFRCASIVSSHLRYQSRNDYSKKSFPRRLAE
jgi:hypothetical protein